MYMLCFSSSSFFFLIFPFSFPSSFDPSSKQQAVTSGTTAVFGKKVPIGHPTQKDVSINYA